VIRPKFATATGTEEGLSVPRHVAIIMDGNGRWAAERSLPRAVGHRAGTDNVRAIIKACVECGVKVLTLYAFSTENWKRPYEEVEALFCILGDVIDRETEELNREGVRIRHLGTLDNVPVELSDRIRRAVEATIENDRLMVNVAFNYGSQAEIVRAVQRIVAKGFPPEQIDADLISEHLDTAGLPDPDLIIRTAGEMRLSNFLLWQAAYAEYWCTDVYWPDFDSDRFKQALSEYGRRERRFGRLSAQGRVNGA
jgi:undecaprenyl diphosphate synthase